jgi:hypothetical protein
MGQRQVEAVQWWRVTEKQIAMDGKKMVLKDVPLDVLNIPTANRTLYKLAHMKPGLERLQELVNRGQGYIFVDHPTSDDTKAPIPNESNLFERAGLRITELKWNMDAGDDSPVQIMADMNVLDTSRGRDIRACLEDGGAIGFSKRGLVGKWIQNNMSGVGAVQEATQYYLEGYDCVIGQAVRAAETRDFVYEQNQKEQVMELKDAKTIDDLKGILSAAAYDHVLTVAKESLRGELATEQTAANKTAVEKAVEDAVIPLKERIEALEAENKKYQTGLEQVVVALSDAELVEKREPEDVEKDLRAKVEQLTKENETLKAKPAEPPAPPEPPAPEIDGEARAKEQLSESEYKAAVVESMKGSKFANEDSFKRALEQANGVAKRAFEAGRGKVETPESTPDDEKTRRAEQIKRMLS